MTTNPTLVERLAGAGEPMLATFVALPRVEIVQLVALAGFDAIIVDLEHGPFTIEQVPPLVMAARAHGLASLVRVSDDRAVGIGGALDAGADGVLVPHVSDRATAEAVVTASRFPPLGERGANPWVAAGEFGSDPTFFATANDRTAVVAMVEGREGVERLDELVSVRGISGVFVGPVDLSSSVGVPGQTDNPDVVRLAGEVIRRAHEAGIGAAVFAPDPAAARRWFGAGARLVALGVDVGHALRGLTAACDEVRAAGLGG